MPRVTRLSTRKKPLVESSDEEDDEPKPTKPKRTRKIKKLVEKPNNVVTEQIPNKDGSSSESDLDAYLKPADQIDLSSSFFQINKKPEENAFETIENNIFAGVNRLSDSESEPEGDSQNSSAAPIPSTSSTNKVNFQQLHDYTKKIEEAKKVVEKYEARKKVKLSKLRKGKQTKENKETTISDLLAKGEAKADSSQDLSKSLHSSDYESFSDSEKDWEEVEHREIKEHKESIVPKEGVQITVQLPGVMRKKKGVDLIASMKRRLNRIRKENQVYVHKVHLLCWIAHGNYVNTVLNNENLLAMAMSLLPSQHCYPPNRTDLSYLEAVVKWFSNAIPVTDKSVSKNLPLAKALRFQINRKQAYNKKMLVYIFICMLRALGIQCRLVISFVVAPLRPPAEELHSLSTKNKDSKSVKKKLKEGELESSEKVEEVMAQTKKDKNVKALHTGKEIKPQTKKEEVKSSKNIKSSDSGSNKNKSSKSNSHENAQQTVKNEKKKLDNKKDESKKKTKQETHKTKKGDSSKIENVPSDNKTTRKIKNEKQATQENRVESKRPNLRSLKNSDSKSQSKINVKERESKPKETSQIPQIDGANDSDSEPKKSTNKPSLKKLKDEEKNPCPIKKHPKRLKSLPNYKENDSEDDFKPKTQVKKEQQSKLNLQKLKMSKSTSNIPNVSPKKNDIRNDIIGLIKGRMAEERNALKAKITKRKKSNNNDSDYDSDYAPELDRKKYYDSDDNLYEKNKTKVKRRVQVKPIDDSDETKKKRGVNVWVEVYLESEERWISADVSKGEVHCINQLYSRAPHPVNYVVAWNNNNTIKDITQRYCPSWNTVTRKLRIDKKWWEATLKPFIGTKTIRDKEEDEDLARLQLEKPLPTSISEYKDHPLYALERHLLKFQAIYPPDSVTLGFIRKEAVYSRDCIHTLHSRETWLKHAKVVKPGEKPYKIVKARPKYDRLSGQLITDLPLEIFGKWQVEDYVPPTAKDGVVPRNAYGNVELFKACMLPKGTVHIQLPGLNKVARKMNIDCVPAVVGFDIHSGWTHPTFDGYVVCEEFSEALIAAWHIEQEEQEKKDQEKIEKRVYDNWKKLIKGLLIRERLKARYDYGAPSQDDAKNKKRKNKGAKLVTKKRRICSDNESN